MVIKIRFKAFKEFEILINNRINTDFRDLLFTDCLTIPEAQTGLRNDVKLLRLQLFLSLSKKFSRVT
jgi:hypothetical protein